jgi:hypothetical protein
MRNFSRYLLPLILAFITLNWLVPRWTHTQYPRLPVPNFSASIRGDYQGLIEQKKPQVILMGNSVLIGGMDEAQFESLTGMRTFKLVAEGGATAQYYLMIKNIIITSQYPPKYLLLFFQNEQLTSPELWTTGAIFIDRLDEIAGQDETVLLQKAYLNSLSPLEAFLNGHVPIFGERQTLKGKIDNHLRYTLPRLVDQCATDCLDRNMESIFNYGNLNAFPITPISLDLEKWRGKAWNFNALLENSFLPDMIQLTHARGIQLILVREKDARIMTAEEETADMRVYFQQLSAYLNEQDVPMIDLAHSPALSLDMFLDSMHFKPFAKPVFTHLVAEGLLPFVKR